MIGNSTVRMRSMHVADFPDDLEVPSGVQIHGTDVKSPQATDTPGGINESSNEEGSPDPLQLPASTHSLLFTQPICSPPFLFALAIVVMSFLCLTFAIISMTGGLGAWDLNIPVNIPQNVKWAQYLSIFMILLMEEEIPTGLYLLRMIPRTSFEEQFPDMSYTRFIISSLVRLMMGYFFLSIVFVVLAQATGVIEIFYDVLALQFIQQLDDIAFTLAKLDVLGKRIQRACTAKCFQTELPRKKIGRSKKLSIFLKAIYLLNCGLLLGGMAFISMCQMQGTHQTKSITVDFGNSIWENALVNMPSKFHEEWVRLYPYFNGTVTPDEHEEWMLIFSYFNGVYKKNGMHANRPVYTEMAKVDSKLEYDLIVPAKIYYCEGINAWVFAHEYIHKSKESDEKGCNWLLRSETTNEYDLMNVGMTWKIWNGVIGNVEISYADNKCSDATDCNLNGQCIDDECKCTDQDGVQHLGSHCQISFKDECETLIGERYDVILVAFKHNAAGNPNGTLDTLAQMYSRPIYFSISGDNYLGEINPDAPEDTILILQYSGNRWFGIVATWSLVLREIRTDAVKENHAFWGKDYDPLVTSFVSDETKKGTPVGVDFYEIGDRGEQFGPFGALEPMQLNKQRGRGFFRCGGPLSSLEDLLPPNRKLQFQNQEGNKTV